MFVYLKRMGGNHIYSMGTEVLKINTVNRQACVSKCSFPQYVQFVSHNRLAQALKEKASQAPQARSANPGRVLFLYSPLWWETTQRRCRVPEGKFRDVNAPISLCVGLWNATAQQKVMVYQQEACQEDGLTGSSSPAGCG